MEFTVSLRTYDPDIRSKVLQSILRIVRSECEASRSPRDAEIERTDTAPPVINNPALTKILRESFEKVYGDEVNTMIPTLASEDFLYLACEDIPYVYWTVGCIDHDT